MIPNSKLKVLTVTVLFHFDISQQWEHKTSKKHCEGKKISANCYSTVGWFAVILRVNILAKEGVAEVNTILSAPKSLRTLGHQVPPDQITSAALMLAGRSSSNLCLACSFNSWSPSRVPWPATTRTTSAGADVEEGVQTDDVVAEVVDDDRVSFHLEVALNIVLDGLGEGGRCNIRPRREEDYFYFHCQHCRNNPMARLTAPWKFCFSWLREGSWMQNKEFFHLTTCAHKS